VVMLKGRHICECQVKVRIVDFGSWKNSRQIVKN
jgi:hypothetical protein